MEVDGPRDVAHVQLESVLQAAQPYPPDDAIHDLPPAHAFVHPGDRHGVVAPSDHPHSSPSRPENLAHVENHHALRVVDVEASLDAYPLPCQPFQLEHPAPAPV
eukprot:3689599-Rhodomonas_salina.1